eukprot:CAMPEP_0114545750 /NCGR_PEP_ID=MMETSP0114-20121206/3577_1 /TAXON_ID=31324 /ORGANISM="Goniomonas sp, Strain m" /LENGTH=40 /DNA_ID= /DNA_START= /DNA_END= /DNA_ORIENTATION=
MELTSANGGDDSKFVALGEVAQALWVHVLVVECEDGSACN